MKIFVAAGIATALASPVIAGSTAPPLTEPVIVAPAPVAVVNTGGEWTGFYAGAQLGYGDLSVDGTGGGDGGLAGVHVGYDYDFGRFVLGGELDYDASDIGFGAGAGSVDSISRVKLRGGYDMGRTLLYVTGGYANINTSLGSQDGYFGGVGVAYQVNDSFTVSGEVLENKFDNVGGAFDMSETTATVRASFRF